jgi:uncharacterized protein with PIN domain
MKFFVDQSLGSLTKWLRFLGFDVVEMELNLRNSHSLPRLKPNNFILTRQTSWPAKLSRPDLIVLAAERIESQLAEICRRLKLSPETWAPLIRCSTCNQILRPISAEQADGRVPDFTSQKYQQFFECPQCRRVYWEGSHQVRIRRQLQKLQDDIPAP